jgi:hypothetical protein
MKKRSSNRGRKAQVLAEGAKSLNPPLARTYENAAEVFDRLKSELENNPGISSKAAKKSQSSIKPAFPG